MKKTKEEKLIYYQNPNLYNKKIQEMENVEERVVWILAKYPKTRNHYNILIFNYWKLVEGMNSFDFYDENRQIELTTSESITRACRHIQNELGLFKPDEEIQDGRAVCEEAVKDWATD